jgi:hypothetical protein
VEIFSFSGSDITDWTYNSRQTRGLLDEKGTPLLSILRTKDGTRYFHILHFIHFMDNNGNGVGRMDDMLWKIRDFFEIIRTNFPKFYNPSEHLAVDKVIVKFKGRVVYTKYIPKTRKSFSIKTFKLFDSTG